MATVFLNGRFIELDDARLGVMDAGTQHAVGLFETMLGGIETPADADPRPWVVDLDAHIDRLIASAEQLGLWPDLHSAGLAEAVLATVARSGLARVRVRLTVTGGDLNLAARDAGGLARPGAQGRRVEPTILIVAQPATQYPQAMLSEGVLVTLADTRANPFNPLEGHKTLNYWWRLRELQIAGAKGAAEALVFDVTNHAAGGCVSNLFGVTGDVVRTPIARGEEGFGPDGPPQDVDPADSPGVQAEGALPSSVLPGVTRQRVLSWLSVWGLAARREMLTINDILSADEVFLTNSSWGILPVRQVESRPIGQGRPGAIATRLVSQWASWAR
jgi:branched-chain amino acid aminotransferase